MSIVEIILWVLIIWMVFDFIVSVCCSVCCSDKVKNRVSVWWKKIKDTM